MAERLGLTSDHRRADAKVMSRSLRSLMKKGTWLGFVPLIFCIVFICTGRCSWLSFVFDNNTAGRDPPSPMSSDFDLPPPTVGKYYECMLLECCRCVSVEPHNAAPLLRRPQIFCEIANVHEILKPVCVCVCVGGCLCVKV